jgi:hypothetical protein
MKIFEAPCSKLQGIFDRKECGLFYDSLAYPAASGGECARFCGSKWRRQLIGLSKNSCRGLPLPPLILIFIQF